MTKRELFDKKDKDLFHPEGIELISTILFALGYTYDNISSKEAREEGIALLKLLLDLDLIEVFHWGKLNEKLKDTSLSKKEILKHIEELWFKGANIQDFYGMIIFKYKDWYINALKREGLRFRGMNWKTFVKNKIGDLERWIEENRPKNTT